MAICIGRKLLLTDQNGFLFYHLLQTDRWENILSLCANLAFQNSSAMIQRIQTVFLFLAAVALGLFLYFPLIRLEPGHFAAVDLKGWDITQRLPFMGDVYIYYVTSILALTAIALTLLNILFYKNRGLQMLLCWFAVVIIVAVQAFVYYKYQTWVFIGDVVLRKWNLFSVVAVLFELLAFFYIRKDEETIKSLDRLR